MGFSRFRVSGAGFSRLSLSRLGFHGSGFGGRGFVVQGLGFGSGFSRVGVSRFRVFGLLVRGFAVRSSVCRVLGFAVRGWVFGFEVLSFAFEVRACWSFVFGVSRFTSQCFTVRGFRGSGFHESGLRIRDSGFWVLGFEVRSFGSGFSLFGVLSTS